MTRHPKHVSPAEAALRAHAEAVAADRETRSSLWSRGFTRRRLVAGAGFVGVAAIGGQLVSTRVSFGQPGAGSGTLVVVFLRGGMDGLSVLVPAEDPHLLAARPQIAVRGGSLLPLDRGFGLHPALAPLHRYWGTKQFTAVPALSTPDLSRSHFQAQDCLERGGSSTDAAAGGWLDRVLQELGPGTTFRGIAEGSTLPRSLVGSQGALALRGVESFTLGGWDGVHDRTKAALATLYTGFEHPLAAQATTTLAALETAERLAAADYRPAVEYPDDGFSKSLANIAQLVKSDVGLRVACVDLGGWDMHTGLGTVDNGDMQRMLTSLGNALGAFAADLGDKLNDVTLVTMTEFGRRIEENANRGTDHGHGAVALLLGGGLDGGTVHGNWQGLAPEVRDHGDVPGSNDYRNLLGEVVSSRLGLGADALARVFPGHKVQPIGVAR
ncbi:MAG TPA: DUF1501 domain-containing protein [Pseudonocardiaceae bacterium]